MSTPLVEVDWDPPSWSIKRWAAVKAELPPEIRNMGTSFFELENSVVIGPWQQAMILDMIALVQASYYVYKIQNTPTPEDERWLYLKTQGVSHQLLARPSGTSTPFQESLRLALLIWLLSVTDYMGSRVAAVETLDYLQKAQEIIGPVSF